MAFGKDKMRGPAGSSAAAMSRRAALSIPAALGLAHIAPAQAQAPEKLRIGMANSVMTVIYPYITNAQQLGFFKQEGVDVDIMMGQGSPQALSLLVAGTADVVFSNPEPMIQLRADRGLPVKSIFVVLQSQYILAVPDDSPIQTVAQLKGKRIGMFSPQSGIDYLKARLQDSGMTVNDITIVPTAFGGQTMMAVRQKQVDAILYWNDALLMMRYAGLKLRELPKADWEKGLYQYGAVATEETIAKRPEALRRALRAMAQGQMFFALSPKKTVEAFWQKYPDQAPKPGAEAKAMDQDITRVREQLKQIGLPDNFAREQLTTHIWGNQTLKAWTQMQDNLLRVGSLSKKVDPATLFDNQFIGPANDFDHAKLVRMAEG
jgi:NitT/TauT family transport system substrate-binding protein